MDPIVAPAVAAAAGAVTAAAEAVVVAAVAAAMETFGISGSSQVRASSFRLDYRLWIRLEE